MTRGLTVFHIEPWHSSLTNREQTVVYLPGCNGPSRRYVLNFQEVESKHEF